MNHYLTKSDRAAGLTDKELPHTLRLLRVCWGETNGMEERENGR